jgi:uncharacterized membrane protein
MPGGAVANSAVPPETSHYKVILVLFSIRMTNGSGPETNAISERASVSSRANGVITFLAIVSMAIAVLTFNTDLMWLGHAVVSIIGTIFVIWIVTTDPSAGRTRKAHGATLLVHRMSIWLPYSC